MATTTAEVTNTADQKLARLAKLARSAGQALWERVVLAAELLADRDWVIEAHAGDEGRARDKLNDRYFPDLFGAMDLNRLLEVYRLIPNEADWKACHYNLTTLWQKTKAILDGQRPKPDRTPQQRVTRAQYEEKEEEVKRLSHSLKREGEATEAKDKRIGTLEARCLELERENANLRGRLQELERLLPRTGAA